MNNRQSKILLITLIVLFAIALIITYLSPFLFTLITLNIVDKI